MIALTRIVHALIVSAVSIGALQEPGQRTAPDSRVRVDTIASGMMLVRDVQGDYRQHTVVFRELMAMRDAGYIGVGDCFGIYPMDPDAVESTAALRWRVGVRVSAKPGQRLQAPKPPYKLERFPATQAAVLETRVDTAATDGLALLRWMPENGYVQTGPTRMEYLSHDGNPLLIPARIIVPIRRRPSGLLLPPK